MQINPYRDPSVPVDRYRLTTGRPVVQLTNNTTPLNGNIIPISRYSGLYYSDDTQERDPKYTGRFYFYEPESSNFLALGQYRVYAIKIHAYLDTTGFLPGETINRKDMDQIYSSMWLELIQEWSFLVNMINV